MHKLKQLFAVFIRYWWVLCSAALLGGYWLLPIAGQVIIQSSDQVEAALGPQITILPASPQPGAPITITLTDRTPWTNVLLAVQNETLTQADWEKHPTLPVWTWRWSTLLASTPEPTSHDVVFFVDCHTGCRARGRWALPGVMPQTMSETVINRQPTKQCVVFADPNRDWHGRNGWVVDMTYVRRADDPNDPYWMVNALAQRVAQARSKGLRVLVRVDYDQGQTLPAEGDFMALSEYLHFIERLAQDERLQSVYAYIIGSGPNAAGSNSLAPDHPITPEWYARLLNGFGEPVNHTDNVVQTIRQTNPTVRVLVGPIRPWVSDQDGSQPYTINVPWLNYFNTLVQRLDQSAQAKAAAGLAGVTPDGFALHVPGRPDAPELAGQDRAQEPALALPRQAWDGAQAGFQLYQNWLDIINKYPATNGLLAYITSTNTATPDENIPPAQNYPAGWYTTALQVINREPQIQTLCWFMDVVPGDDRWDAFSLTRQPGRMLYVAEEFDTLLRGEGTP